MRVQAVSRVYVETFEKYSIGTEFKVYDAKGNVSTQCKAVVAEDPVTSGNKVLRLVFKGGTYGPQISLPSGADINSYTSKYNIFAFDCYLNPTDGSDSRRFFLLSGTDTIYYDKSAGAIASKKELWNHKSYQIEHNSSTGKSIVLGFYGGVGGDLFIDNIRFASMPVDKSYLTDETKSVRYWADLLGKDFGVAINSSATKSETQSAVTAAAFNTIVAEWEMKFSNTEKTRNVFNYKEGDALYKFASENGMKLRGHCLVWHESVPSWVSSDGIKNDKKWTREELQKVLKNHIMNVAGHYKGKVYEWDVVNECLSNDQSIIKTNSSGYTMRNTVWYDVIGEDFLDSAFVWAHRADPDAKLYLNDYGNEKWSDAKSKAFYNLVKSMKRRGVPINGVGLQCHYNYDNLDSTEIANTVYEYKKLGLELKFTEIDLSMQNSQFYSDEQWEEQARTYRVLANICRLRPYVTGMLVWGLSDGQTWVTSTAAGTKGQPLLLNYFYGAKPGYEAIRRVFRDKVIDSGILSPSEERIARDNTVYDLTGKPRYVTDDPRSIYSLPKGLYIYNGQKYIVK